MKAYKTTAGILSMLLTLVAGLFLNPLQLKAQHNEVTETIEKTVTFNRPGEIKNKLIVKNIHGSVTVQGYEGHEVKVTVRKSLSGTESQIQQAQAELELKVESRGDTILIYPDAPFIEVDERNGYFSFRMDRRDDSYKFRYDITVRVPLKTHIEASTVNRGPVVVEGTRGRVSASNVNGEVKMTDISGPTEARTVNGDITARYSQSPDRDSEYKTVNGTINVFYPSSLSADIRFKSLHGELYTDFQNIQHLQTRIEQDKRTHHGGVKYRVEKFSPVRIGEGGPTYRFQVLNGSVYIKQIKS